MPRRPELRAALLTLLLYLLWAFTLPSTYAWGWDETLHAELPAARFALALRHLHLGLFFETLHDCQQYPPVGPLLLALPQALLGVSELTARLTQLLLWAATLQGLFLLGQELNRARTRVGDSPADGDAWLPWILWTLGALSPLALHFAGTLFLETPFTLCAVFALRAWLRRGAHSDERESRRNLAWREFVAGAWLAAALFTKFNYGLLLAFGLSLDALCELVVEARAGRASEFLRRCALLAVVPALACVYWFVLPLPEGFETAAEHRAAFLGFLGGNLEMARTPWQQRVLFAACHLTLTARLFALELVAVAASARRLGRPGVRALWLVLLGAGLPVWLHRFHLERFLIPGGPALWALAAVGLVDLLPRAGRARLATAAALAVVTLAWPSADVGRVAGALGLLSPKEDVRALQLGHLHGWSRLFTQRPLPTAGAPRETYDALLALAAAEVGPDERVAWLGTSSELSPGAIHLSLYLAGGAPERLVRDAVRPMDVTFEARDPQWTDEEFAAFASRFDVALATEPPDLRGRAGREFVRGYAQRLVDRLGWSAKLLGDVRLPGDSGAEATVRLYALRPPR